MGNQASKAKLQDAIKAGQINDVRALLDSGIHPDVQFQDMEAYTALTLAAKNGHKEIVDLLISQGANVNLVNYYRWTPLYGAAKYGHENVAALLISKGANINEADSIGMTPLCIAAENGHKDVVDLLISKGANVNQAKRNGTTPLLIAAINGHKDVVALLIAAKVDVNHATGGGSLFAAATNGHKDVVELLISNGAKVNHATNDGQTPLYIAAKYGHGDVVAHLISKGANVNQACNDGSTPLHIAAVWNHVEVASLLIASEAEVDQVNSDGETPLCIAAKGGKGETTSLFISSGADIHHRTKSGYTPLHIAVYWCHIEGIVRLLQANADIDSKTNDGLTPLMIATQRNYNQVVELLNKTKQELIIRAVKTGDERRLEELLAKVENVNIIDENGNNLLHIAIQSNQPLTLNILLELPNIQLNLQNQKMETPFVLAMKLRNRQIINIIDAAINKPMQDIDINDIKYENNGFLGNGAFGAVYKGQYNNEMVAIKKMLKQPDKLDEFEREINAMRQCRSPYLLHLTGVAELNTNEPKIVLQFMDGGDLRDHLNKLRNNQTTKTNYSILEIAWAIANGLADIHNYNYVHRDLKSHNVLLSTEHYIKLADLGLTRDIASKMSLGVGTLQWTAPEVLKDDCRYGAPADIYSFGVVLTELDTLVLPYSNPKLANLVIQNGVCAGTLRPALSGTCKPWYKKLVNRCLNGDPTLRPSASEIVTIIENRLERSDNEDEDDTVDEPSEAQPERERLNTPSKITTTPSMVPIAPQRSTTDVNCPSCKESNSLLNEVCKKCNKPLLDATRKINILIHRLQVCNREPHFVCAVCHFEIPIKSSTCATCQENLIDADKVTQLVAQLMEAQ